MWALVEDNEVSKVFPRPKAITIGENQYPQNIFNVWSSEELEAIGIYEVVIDNSKLKIKNITLTLINLLILLTIQSQLLMVLRLQKT